MTHHRLDIAKSCIGEYRSMLIETSATLDPDGATGERAELERVREAVAAEAGCEAAEAGTISLAMHRAPADGSKWCSGCGAEIPADEGHWHDGMCLCDGCEAR